MLPFWLCHSGWCWMAWSCCRTLLVNFSPWLFWPTADWPPRRQAAEASQMDASLQGAERVEATRTSILGLVKLLLFPVSLIRSQENFIKNKYDQATCGTFPRGKQRKVWKWNLLVAGGEPSVGGVSRTEMVSFRQQPDKLNNFFDLKSSWRRDSVPPGPHWPHWSMPWVSFCSSRFAVKNSNREKDWRDETGERKGVHIVSVWLLVRPSF